MIDDVKTLGELIDRAAETWPDHEAIIHGDKRFSYREVRERANRLAAALLDLGVRKGDKVAILLTNLPQWAFAEFAVDKLGAVVVPINTRYTPDEMRYILTHSDSTTLIMMDRFLKLDYMDMIKRICPELEKSRPGHLKSKDLPFLRNVIVWGDSRCKGTIGFTDLIESYGGEADEALINMQGKVEPDDIAHLPYTSGTTGKPKGVMTTHLQYIRFNLGFIRGIGGFAKKDRLCVAAPFSHNFGNSQGILTPAFCGSVKPLTPRGAWSS
jgi:fatty-acyl-CoA synthase